MTQGSVARALQMCPKCSENNTLTARSCIRCGCALPSIPLLAKHTILNNRYMVMQVLGLGGFSAVYLALDHRMSGRKVAIKELLYTDLSIIKQFETEAKLLMNLSHRALPKALDWFKQPGSERYYFVMEFIEGISTWELVNHKGPMKPLAALRLMEPIFDAVAYLHRQNPPIVHRDINPQNILVTKERKVYLVDFGIPKVGSADQKTATGAKGVAPGFSPPEQYLATGEIDVRSDIYSLGATMYFLLTGKVPPEAPERLQREMAGQPSLELIRPVNTAVSHHMEQAILMAMVLRKEQRFSTVSDFLAGLKGQTTLIQPQAPMPASQPPMSQSVSEPASTLQALLASKLVRVGAIIALLSFTILPLFSGKVVYEDIHMHVRVIGLHFLILPFWSSKISSLVNICETVVIIFILNCIIALFLQKPFHCFISCAVGLAIFIIFVIWIHGALHGSALHKLYVSALHELLGVHLDVQFRFGIGVIGTIVGRALATLAAYQWHREEMSKLSI